VSRFVTVLRVEHHDESKTIGEGNWIVFEERSSWKVLASRAAMHVTIRVRTHLLLSCCQDAFFPSLVICRPSWQQNCHLLVRPLACGSFCRQPADCRL
jgi:hypothetical protein